MIRGVAITLILLAVAGCSDGSESTQDSVATEPESNIAPSSVESTDIDTTLSPDTTDTTAATASTATTEALVVEGADSSEDAVNEWYTGLAESDLSRMWAIIDPDLKTGLSRSAWDACILAQLDMQIDSIDYDEADVYIEDGSVFSTGAATLESDGEEATLPLTFEVVEHEGGWFAVGTVDPNNELSCLEKSAG